MIDLPTTDLPLPAIERIRRRAQSELRREVALRDAPFTRVLSGLERGTLVLLSACFTLWGIGVSVSILLGG